MRGYGIGWAAALALALSPGAARAQQKVSFSKEIVPIFRESCIKCHSNRQPQGGLALASYAALEKGGKGGRVLAPRAADSRLLKYLLGTLQPRMPIGGSLPKEQIEKIRAWIDQGAPSDVEKDRIVIPDTAIPAIKVPRIVPKVPMLPEAVSLAWSNDNKVLAIGTYQVVRLVDPSNGSVIRELKGHADKVHSLQFSPNGRWLAAAGGPPAQQGEIKIWEVASGALFKTISGHNDFIYSCAWSPDSARIASASYDKLIKVWDVNTGAEAKTLKDHADAVYAVAWHPEGKVLASGSADRSVKFWDVESGKRIFTAAGHTDTVFSLAWNKAGNQITSTGADRTVRTWNWNGQSANQARNMTAHEKTVNEVVYSPDGTLMATASDDRSVKIWNAGNGSQTQALGNQPEAMMSVAFSGDNKQVAVGSFDGTVRIYTVADGKLAATIIDLPKPPPAPAAKPAPAAPKPAPPAKTAVAKPAAAKRP